jgi:hypothetical protein
VALWEAFYTESKHFDLHTLRAPNRSPTPISKSNDFLRQSDNIWGARGPISGRCWGFPGSRPAPKHTYFPFEAATTESLRIGRKRRSRPPRYRQSALGDRSLSKSGRGRVHGDPEVVFGQVFLLEAWVAKTKSPTLFRNEWFVGLAAFGGKATQPNFS